MVFNSLSWDRGGVVTLPWSKELRVWAFDRRRRRLPSKIVDCFGKKQLEIRVPEIPALGYQTFVVREADAGETQAPLGEVTISGRVIDSYSKITFNERDRLHPSMIKVERKLCPQAAWPTNCKPLRTGHELRLLGY